ncbi:hypothetical protein EQV90_19230 [Pseudomonas sp. TMW22089]|nr:hypothetical protein [Pseudomonas sp. TMW22089]NBG93390.1 hypothetical protein [Pseudomonas sp. 9.1(2019)]
MQFVSGAGYSQRSMSPSAPHLLSKKDQPMPVCLSHSVVVSAVSAGVVPCANQQPAQISHYPPPVSRTVASPPGVVVAG